MQGVVVILSLKDTRMVIWISGIKRSHISNHDRLDLLGGNLEKLN